tara:strand:- start:857 stop:1177 length:321 start_codon:yes stop_codon:yes gene_type:complete
MSEIVERLTQFVSCPICGSEFKRKSTLHKFCSEKCKWKNKTLKRGETPGAGNKREISYNDKVYPSVTKFCVELNLDRSAFSKSLIKFDGDVERALEHYRNRKQRKG